MKKILDRWYVGFILLPILLTYFTNYFSINFFLKDWKISAIISLLVLNIILAYELYKKQKLIRNKKLADDIKTAKKLLDILDLDTFQKEIYEQDSWYGYRRDAIQKILDFIYEVSLISNLIENRQLNNLLTELGKILDEFYKLSSTQLYADKLPEWYTPDKNTEIGREKIEGTQPIMNGMTDKAYRKLVEILTFIKKNEPII